MTTDRLPLTRVLHILCMAFMALAVLMAVLVGGSSAALANPKYASIVIDADTGQVLSQSNADKILHPASLTKMMTMLMIFDGLQHGTIRLNDKISISSHAASMQPSKLGLPVGSTIRVEDAIKALATKSANDIAAAVAEFIGGSEENFGRQMTLKAQAMGMTRTRFVNASGLHDPRQVSTARDMARLSLILIKQYPAYYHYFSTKNFTYRGKSYHSHNRLMSTYEGMDGLKTGYILASGFNLAASAKRQNRRLVGVVFGGKTWKSRNDHMASLLDRGFAKILRDPAPTGSATHVLSSASPRRTGAQAGPKMAALPATPVLAISLMPAIQAFAVPVPPMKPSPTQILAESGQASGEVQDAEDIQTASASDALGLASIEPSAGAVLTGAQDKIIRALANTLQERNENMMSNIMGQGDVDEDSAVRFQTGLMAIAAHTHREYSIEGIGRFGTNATPKTQSFNTNLATSGGYGDWSVQVGAFKSRAQTDEIIRSARSKLPDDLLYGRAIIMPTTINNQILFRGRLSGYNEEHARKICDIISDCMVITPAQ